MTQKSQQQGVRIYGSAPYDKLYSDLPGVIKLFRGSTARAWQSNRLAAIRNVREIAANSKLMQNYLTAARASVVGDVCPMPTFSMVESEKDRKQLLSMWEMWAMDVNTDGGEGLAGLLRSLLTTMLIEGRVLGLLRNHRDYTCGLAIQPVPRDWLADQEYPHVRVQYASGEAIGGVIRNKSSSRVESYVFVGERQDTAEQIEEEMMSLSKGLYGTHQHMHKTVVPAERVLDFFTPRSADDYEGSVSHLLPALATLEELTRLDAAVITSMHISSQQLGFIEPDKEAPFLKDIKEAGEAAKEELVYNPVEFPPNKELFELQRGHKFAQFKHNCPNGDIVKYREVLVQNIAASLGIDYGSISGNDTDANYSSMRASAFRAQATHRILQEAIAQRLLRPILRALIESAEMRGDINITNKSKATALRTTWRQKHFDYVDPEKDMKAAMLEMQAGVLSPQQLAHQLGRNIDQIYAELEDWKEKMEELNMPFPPGAPSMPAQPNNETDGEESPEEAEAAAEGSAENE